MRTTARAVLAALVLLPLTGCGLTPGSDGPTVNVYSARTYGSEAVFERFTQETGVEVEFLNGSDAELRERLAEEGADTDADVFLTVDVANLALAAEQDLFQPVSDPALDAAVPAALRDPQGRWFSLAKRARAVVYDPAEVEPSELSTYAALAGPEWKGRLCLRTSTSPYTQSLVSALIANEGEAAARKTVEGWVANAQIIGNDVEILETIAAGGCDVGITNHYYLARELDKDPDFGVELFWPDQQGDGVHVNVSGAGVTKHAKDPELAKQFLTWMATNGQSQLVDQNFEYPVNPTSEPVETIRAFGEFTQDDLNLEQLAEGNADAVRLLTEAGYR